MLTKELEGLIPSEGVLKHLELTLVDYLADVIHRYTAGWEDALTNAETNEADLGLGSEWNPYRRGYMDCRTRQVDLVRASGSSLLGDAPF